MRPLDQIYLDRIHLSTWEVWQLSIFVFSLGLSTYNRFSINTWITLFRFCLCYWFIFFSEKKLLCIWHQHSHQIFYFRTITLYTFYHLRNWHSCRTFIIFSYAWGFSTVGEIWKRSDVTYFERPLNIIAAVLFTSWVTKVHQKTFSISDMYCLWLLEKLIFL